jgi:protein SCO1
MRRRAVFAGLVSRAALSLVIGALLTMPLSVPATPAGPLQKTTEYYTCPMDPDVRATKPGKCPKCGMALRRSTAGDAASDDTTKSDSAGGGDLTNLRVPDITAYDQNGRELKVYSDLIKGKTVAINFIFTTCTTICPPLTATFRKLQIELGERVGRDVALISVSIDPAVDTPERLKGFAAKFGAGPGWTFLTGSKPEIDILLRALGASVADKTDHSPFVLIGNEPAGYWTRVYGLAPPATLVNLVTRIAEHGADLPASGRSDLGKSEPAATSPVPIPGSDEAGTADRRVERRVQPPRPADAAGPRPPAEAVAARAAGYFPNLVLLTQDNQPVRFYEDLLKGKTVLINFMFTTCAGICPPMTANLKKVQDYLKGHVGRDVNMISITVDPTVDTPATLKKYADGYKINPGWFFLTGKKENVDWILYKLGGYVEDKNTHKGILIIGNEQTGRWLKVFAMAKPSEIADAVLRMADPPKDQSH